MVSDHFSAFRLRWSVGFIFPKRILLIQGVIFFTILDITNASVQCHIQCMSDCIIFHNIAPLLGIWTIFNLLNLKILNNTWFICLFFPIYVFFHAVKRYYQLCGKHRSSVLFSFLKLCLIQKKKFSGSCWKSETL